MNLEELRAEIDTIDDSLLQDFAQRMNVVGQIGLEKKSEGLPTLDPAREREKLADIVTKLPPEMEQYGYTLWSMLFEISRSYQSSLNPQPSALRKDIERAIADTQ
ncbi:MAG: chorismate mutase, partial [Bacillota bacterium]|nr:chorismate mutase [Bacillota bacterium]